MTKKILWIINDFDHLDHEHDTTLRIIQECITFGIQNHISNYQTLSLIENKATLISQKVIEIKTPRSRIDIVLEEPKAQELDSFDVSFFRVDPPVDLTYVQHLQVINAWMCKNQSNAPLFFNPIHQLLSYSEKFHLFEHLHLFPRTTISSNWEVLLKFGENEKKTVLKPLNEAQGRGVKLLQWNKKLQIKKNFTLLNKLSDNFKKSVLLQEYLDDINNGEVRLWFTNGKLICAVKKKSNRLEFQFDLEKGDVLIPYELTKSEAKSATIISNYLIQKKIMLAAVDMIDNKITDFNITSPGLIVEMEKVTNRNLCRLIVEELKKVFV